MLRDCITVSSRHLLILICVFFMSTSPSANAATSSYVIVLAATPGSGNQWQAKTSPLLDGFTVYVSQATIKGNTWERLKLGFFDSHQQAAAYAKKIHAIYPGAWPSKVDSNEIAQAGKTALLTSSATAPVLPVAAAATTSATTKTAVRNTSGLSDAQLDSLMQRAKTEFTAKNYAQAIRYFNAIVSSGDSQYSREALELLGLSRHRNGQEAHARAMYEKYIELYPQGEATDRVKQRLSGLLTETSAPKEKLQMSAEKNLSDSTTYGSISQFYRNDTTTTSDAGSINTLSQLITFFDVTSIITNNNFEHRFQFTADDSFDFLADDKKNEFRFIEMYYDFAQRNTGTSARIGRQRLRIGGLYTRYDGASAGYQITPEIRLGLLGGIPVETEDKTSINEHKKLYGATFESGTFLNNWDMSLYHIIQTVDDIDDHINTGSEVHYRDKTLSAFGLIDYDSLFNVVNIAQLNTNLIMDGGRTAYFSAFTRKAPLIATSNALVGRTETSIEEMLQTLNIEQIHQLARDRTANSQTTTVGGSQPWTEKTSISADLTLSRIGSTVESGGVAATESTGTDVYVGTQLVINGLLLSNDTSVLGIRLLNTKASDTISLIANTRIPITREWRVNPRLQYDIRKLSDGRKQNKLRTLIRTDYRYLRKVRLDFEIGYDSIDETSGTGAFNNSSLFYSLGYRYDF